MLELEGITKTFAGLHAVDDLDLSVPEGVTFGVIGPNGAGKTTLFNLVTGLVPPTAGSVRFRDEDITRASPHRIAALGLSRTFQNVRLFGHLTVLQNVLVGQHRHARAGLRSVLPFLGRGRERALREEARELLRLLHLDGRAHHLAGELPYAHQRRLEIARALATKPALLLLDEPAAGMGSAETEQLGEDIATIRQRGCTVVLVEHHMGIVMSVCDMVAVLNFGAKIAEGTPAEVRRDPAVVDAYLGSVQDD